MMASIRVILALAATVTATTHKIGVGTGGQHVFTPDSLTAEVGDVLEFHFYSGTGNHSAVSGPFKEPCTPGNGGFFSTLVKGDMAGTPTFSVEVKDKSPIWYYCSLFDHCNDDGMVGVINPPANRSINDYRSAALKARYNLTPQAPGAFGGTLANSSAANSTSNSTMSMSPGATKTAIQPTEGSATGSATSTGDVAATSKPSSAGKTADVGSVFGMCAIAGVLVALLL